MDNSILEHTQVKARIFDQYNPKASISALVIGMEIYPCGFIMYTLFTVKGDIIYRSQDEIVPLPPQ